MGAEGAETIEDSEHSKLGEDVEERSEFRV